MVGSGCDREGPPIIDLVATSIYRAVIPNNGIALSSWHKCPSVNARFLFGLIASKIRSAIKVGLVRI